MTTTHIRFVAGAGITALLLMPLNANAQTAPTLGNAAPFVVLGGASVTNTGPSVLNGDLGSWPTGTITGFPPGVVNGTNQGAGTASQLAQQSVTTAANALLAQPCGTTFGVPTDIGGTTRTAGVYCFTSSGAITGTLTLDAGGNANAVFIFITGSTLVTAAGSNVLLINGAQACNVFWRVGSSATLGTTTSFVGNILASTSITITTGATVQGRALAQTGSVTLDSNVLTRSFCAAGTIGAPPPGTIGAPDVVAPPGTTPPIGGCPVITVAPATIPSGVVGVAYTQTMTAGNGLAADTTYVFDVMTGALPPGLTLSTAGVISGTPLSTGINGSYSFAIRARAPNTCSGAASYTTFVSTAVPTLPQAFAVLLTLSLLAAGAHQLRRRRSNIL